MKRIGLTGLVQKSNKLTKKAAAAIPTPAARIEVILDGFCGPGLRFCRSWVKGMCFARNVLRVQEDDKWGKVNMQKWC